MQQYMKCNRTTTVESLEAVFNLINATNEKDFVKAYFKATGGDRGQSVWLYLQKEEAGRTPRFRYRIYKNNELVKTCFNIRDIADFLNVSFPTAKNYLNNPPEGLFIKRNYYSGKA